ncbi:DUF2306 domain-containing protein [Shewanella woodyi]|uniref:DUF2306 domain-containing protein n=1 Tax=Shewanella woodyi TaxID=60961 RepID=UPI0007F91BCE|nr:DUF2306 domain-containing protein [Shewanella woodyi]
MLIFHITAGAIALLCGITALISRKGTKVHRTAGNGFFFAMMTVAATAIYLDAVKMELPVMGILTGYMASTSWMAIKRPEGSLGLFDKLAFATITALAATLFILGSLGVSPGTNIPSAFFYIFGSVAAFAATLDLIMLLKGGVYGKHRVARHLWRMCIAMIMATMSFLAQKAAIPEVLHGSSLLWMPVLLLFIFMFYWLIKMIFSKRYQVRVNRAEVEQHQGK